MLLTDPKQAQWAHDEAMRAERRKAEAAKRARLDSLEQRALRLPDWTDEVLKAVRASEALRQQTGRTRASAFATGMPRSTGPSLLGGA